MNYSFTINTDASHDPTTKIATWACWIKSTHYLMKDSGVFADTVPNSSVAEGLAVGQALGLLDKLIDSQEFLKSHRDHGTITVYFNTDSTWVIGALLGVMRRSKNLKVARHIKSLADGYEIIPKHVKGHIKIKDARTYVNSWCDRECRALLRKELKKRGAK